MNVVGNYFQPDPRTDVAYGIILSPRINTDVYSSDNVAGTEGRIPGQSLDGGNQATPHAAPAVPTLPACQAAREVLADVGAPHRTAEEQALVNLITLSGCPQ